MAPRRKEISYEVRELIAKLSKERRSYGEIGKIVNKPHSSVQTVIKNYGERNCVENKLRSGRPRKLTEREGRSILAEIKNKPSTSSTALANSIKDATGKDVHPTTVRRLLHRSGYNSRSARKKTLHQSDK